MEPFLNLRTSQDLVVLGPSVLADHQGFVPAPIDTSSISLPGALCCIREKLSHNLHEVWARNKIEAGFRFGEVRRRGREGREGRRGKGDEVVVERGKKEES